MPTGNLPSSGKALWEKVYEASKKSGDSEEIAAKKAWAAVKQAGWSKDDSGEWHKKSDLSEFSLTVRKVYEANGERRWRADASDVDTDLYGDSMSHELYEDFLSRIESDEAPPERYKSDFWDGGMPYLSVSHYLDQNGDAVPGPVDAVYIDGKFLKAKGRLNDTPLGSACFNALCSDMQEKSDADNKVRISIAFLDYKHTHKSNGVVFERNDETPFCLECLREMVSGEYGGKTYQKGHLIHLALTRVPVNPRTIMEVDKSMTTRKEDAASIVGEELASQLDENDKIVGKSDALVIKADTKKCPHCGKDMQDGKCPECDKEDKEEKSQAVPEVAPSIPDIGWMESKFEELKSLISAPKSEPVVEKSAHVLDSLFDQFKRDFDSIMLSDSGDKLQQIQGPFNVLGDSLVNVVRSSHKEDTTTQPESTTDVVLNALASLNQKVDLLAEQVKAQPVATPNAPVIPARRSINPTQISESLLAKKTTSITPKLHEIVNRSVGIS